MTSYEAYQSAYFSHTKPGFDIKYYQQVACMETLYAFLFARDIPGADIEYCQEHACKWFEEALHFAKSIPGANIEYCRKACESSDYWLRAFDKMILKKALL